MAHVIDFLACPNCGSPFTEGKPCNLTCNRALMVSNSSEDQKAQRFMAELQAVRFYLHPERVPFTDYLGLSEWS